MILAATVLAGLAVFSAQVAVEWARRLAAELDATPWGPRPRAAFRPHPHWRVIRKA